MPKDNLSDTEYEELQAIAETYDKRAKPRKDSTLNMRVSSEMIERMKARAKREGYAKYQAWVHDTIQKALESGG